MAKRYPSPPRYLLFIISCILISIAIVYGTIFGWLSAPVMFLYAFFIIYFCAICKGDKAATSYTIAGGVTSVIFLLAINLFNSILGAMIGIITAYFVFFMTDIILKCDWRYFSLGDFNLTSFPVERSLQFMYDQHVPVSDPPPAAEADPSTPESTQKQNKQRKKIEKPLSRKEKKAEAKKQKKDKL